MSLINDDFGPMENHFSEEDLQKCKTQLMNAMTGTEIRKRQNDLMNGGLFSTLGQKHLQHNPMAQSVSGVPPYVPPRERVTSDNIVRAMPLDDVGYCDACKRSNVPLVIELANAEIYMCFQCIESMRDKLKTVLTNHLLGIEEDV